MEHFLSTIDEWDTLLGIVLSFIAALIAIVKYFDAKKKYFDTKKEEFKKEFWTKRYENYERVLELTSKIAVSKNLGIVQEEIKEFRQYYWGKLAMIEDQNVFDMMIQFDIKLKYLEGSGEKDFNKIQEATYDLARACRKSLQQTWEPVEINDLKDLRTKNINPDE